MQRQTLAWILAASVCTLLAACSSSWFSYVGDKSRAEGRISLEQGGPHPGTWQDPDLIVRYTYTREPQRLNLEGQLELGARLTKSFSEVKDFSTLVAFTDDENRIRKTEVLVSVGNSTIRPWYFAISVPIAPQITAMNFSYRGTAFDSAEEGGKVSSSFWKNP